jgi:hypothetical protein
MLLIRALHCFASNFKAAKPVAQDGSVNRSGRMLYDIPNYFNTGKFHYKINE